MARPDKIISEKQNPKFDRHKVLVNFANSPIFSLMAKKKQEENNYKCTVETIEYFKILSQITVTN